MIWIFFMLVTTIHNVHSQPSTAKYMCLYDDQTHTLTFNIRVTNDNNQIDTVHAYHSSEFDASPERKLNPLDNCTAVETSPGSNTWNLIVEIETSTELQKTSNTNNALAQTENCGISMINQTYKLVLGSFETQGLVRDTDRFFIVQCSENTASDTWISAEVLPAGDIAVEDVVRNRSTTFIITDAMGVSVSSIELGQPIRLQFNLSFDTFEDGIDVLGAQLTDLIIADNSAFTSPVALQLIDEHGCASSLSSSYSAVKLNAGFKVSQSTIAGKSPFIAQTELFDSFKFKGKQNIYFQVKIKKYCKNSMDTVCFVDMCDGAPKVKREILNDLDEDTMSVKLAVYVVTSQQEGVTLDDHYTDSLDDCFKTNTFISASIVTFILHVMMITVCVYLILKTKNINKQHQ